MEEYSKLLKSRMENFYGFGNWNAPIWYIGLEEGSSDTKSEIIQRLTNWEQLGKGTLIDNFKFHQGIKVKKKRKIPKKDEYKDYTIDLADLFNQQNPILQQTWSKLIRFHLALKGVTNITSDDVKKYQSQHWGRTYSDNALLDFYPLPASGQSSWLYNEWFPQIDFLRSKSIYKNAIRKVRLEYIQNMIKQYNPKVVVLYKWDKEFTSIFNDLTGTSYYEQEHKSISEYETSYFFNNKTHFFQVGQPNYIRGNEFWENAGIYIKKK